jgi:predicted NUDIX family NTP pyrophosphohydrolase
MKKQSAGILLYRFNEKTPEVLLVHPGGPFYVKKDKGVWSIPKGEFKENENALDTAKRELREETGMPASSVSGEFIALTPLKQKSGKVIYAWALQGEFDIKEFTSNTFELEWPPKSGRKQEFPEMDRAQWFDIKEAKEKILSGQVDFIDELVLKLQ